MFAHRCLIHLLKCDIRVTRSSTRLLSHFLGSGRFCRQVGSKLFFASERPKTEEGRLGDDTTATTEIDVERENLLTDQPINQAIGYTDSV